MGRLPHRLNQLRTALMDFDPYECLFWEGRLQKNGYVRLYYEGIPRLLHVVSFREFYGRWPDPELELDHLCENPSCYNPYHLEEVTHQVNMDRALRKTHCLYGHLLTDNRNSRACITCSRARANLWYANKVGRPVLRGGVKTHCIRGHSLTDSYVRIDNRGRIQRNCRQCALMRAAAQGRR